MSVAQMLQVEPERIHIDFAGLNHMVFGLNVYLDGQNITGQIIDRIAQGDTSGIRAKNIIDLGWEKEFIKALGILPCPYHRYYFQTEKMLAEEQEQARKTGTRAEVVQKVEAELFEKYKDPKLAAKPPELEQSAAALTTVMPPAT